MTSPQPIGSYSLDDRYVRTAGTVHLTGVQALVRAIRDRAILDRARGCHTATFVAGYEGSPLAGLDLEIARQRGALDGFDIVHRPAVNEELAATSVMGTQLAGSAGRFKTRGITGYWYGKSPGLDRASDALRHANLIGTDPLGGAVALVGDDPGAKSSTRGVRIRVRVGGLDDSHALSLRSGGARSCCARAVPVPVHRAVVGPQDRHCGRRWIHDGGTRLHARRAQRSSNGVAATAVRARPRQQAHELYEASVTSRPRPPAAGHARRASANALDRVRSAHSTSCRICSSHSRHSLRSLRSFDFTGSFRSVAVGAGCSSRSRRFVPLTRLRCWMLVSFPSLRSAHSPSVATW
jgi:hypothetical protein